jgi:WD40 repeat protein
LIWQTDTGQPAAAVSGPIDFAFWLEGGLLLGAAGTQPRLVDPEIGRTRAVLQEQQVEVIDAQASGKRLATADVDGTIRIWDLGSGRLLGELKQSGGGLAPYLQWSADGRYLLGAGSGVVLWDVKDQKGVPISREAGQSVRAKFSPDGRYVAGGIDSTVYVWDAKTRKQLWSSPAHGNQLHGVQWVSGARWDGPGSRLLLLSWAGDGTARVWDWKSDAEILRLADKGSIRFAAANADGSMMLTANSNGTLRAWNTWLNDPAKLLQTTKEHTTRPVEGTPAALRGNSTIVP